MTDVDKKFIMTEDQRKGQCCKTCKSYKKGSVTEGDKKVDVMQCQSKYRGAGHVVEPPNSWCGWWES